MTAVIITATIIIVVVIITGRLVIELVLEGAFFEKARIGAQDVGGLNLLQKMQERPDCQDLVGKIASAMNRREEQASEEFSAIMSTIQQDLAWLGDPVVQENLKRSDVDFAALKGTTKDGKRVKGAIIAVVLPLEFNESHAAIPRLALGCAIQEMQRLPTAREKVLFIIDEAAALGKVTRLPNWLATLRKYNVVLWPIFQNLGQVEDLYGKGWQTFLANCGLRQFIGVGDPALHQASSGRTEYWSAVSCRENRLICAACHHNVVRSAPQAMQP